MKNFAVVLIYCILLFSCSQSREEMIIGRWEYSRIEVRPTTGNNNMQQQLQSMTQGLMGSLYDGMAYDFRGDGTCTITYPLLQTTTISKFRLSDDGQSIYFEDATVSSLPAKIMKLTNGELWLSSDNNSAIVFEKQ